MHRLKKRDYYKKVAGGDDAKVDRESKYHSTHVGKEWGEDKYHNPKNGHFARRRPSMHHPLFGNYHHGYSKAERAKDPYYGENERNWSHYHEPGRHHYKRDHN